jgi:uncharacterized SAM-binding protein YcdF (DUF218 family)
MLLIVVHRFLQEFFMPPLNSMLIIILGLLLVNKKLGKIIILLGLLTLYIQSIPYTVNKLNIVLPPLQHSQLQLSDAIIVLGGGVNKVAPEYPLKANVSANTALRLNYVALLAKQNESELLILSGGYAGNLREADVMQYTLRNIYAVHNPIILENKSRNTEENAKFVSNIIKPLHITKPILITQEWHINRAKMLFAKYGINVIPAPTGYFDTLSSEIGWLAFLPNATSMNQLTTLYHEWLGYIIYKWI